MRQAGEARFTGSVGDSAGHRYPLCSSKCNPRAKMHRTGHCQGTPLFREVVSGIVLRTIYLSYCPTNRMRQTSPAPSSGEPEDRVRTDPCLCRTGRTQQKKKCGLLRHAGTQKRRERYSTRRKNPPPLNFSLMERGGMQRTWNPVDASPVPWGRGPPIILGERSVCSPAFTD